MRRLKGWFRWLRRDQGIALVLVGVMLAVILALAGMAVDLGVVYAERRELRNGADAAALAIAADCGMGTRPCDEPTALATAEEYADANAWDRSSTVDSVELTLTGADTGSVRVRTSAWDAANSQPGVRVPLLSLLGFHRVQVGATATAIFGGPSTGGGLPLIIGTCEYHAATNPHVGGGYGANHLVTLWFKDPKGDTEQPCPADPAGKDAPGSFGWLKTPDDDSCFSGILTVGGLAAADPGFSPSKGCKRNPPPLDADYLIPIYSEVGGQGNNTRYTVAGFAFFHLMGYSFPNWGSFGEECDASGKGCITGWFATDTLYEGEIGGPNFGLVLVKLTE
jgi:Flp pilus assembly protein TadG